VLSLQLGGDNVGRLVCHIPPVLVPSSPMDAR
jgi:hypothetical protein